MSNFSKFFLFSILFLISSYIYGQQPIKSVNKKEIIDRVNANYENLKSLESEGEIEFLSAKDEIFASFFLSVKKPDSIYIKLRGPFGVNYAYMLITRQNFIYHNLQDNYVIKGTTNPCNIYAILKLRLEFDEILKGITGTYFFKDTDTSSIKLQINKDDYLISFKDTTELLNKKIWIDRNYYNIIKTLTTNDTGITKYRAEYSNYIQKSGIFFSKVIGIEIPKDKVTVNIIFKSETFNKENLTYKIQIPKSARIIQWD